MEQFPGNSKSPRVVHEQTQKKEVKKIVTGEVIRRKQPLGRRVAQNVVGGDARSVWGYVVEDLLLPAARNMISDAGRGLLDGMIYGDTGGRGPRRSSGRSHTDYGRAYQSRTLRPRDDRRDDRRDYGHRERAGHRFDQIILDRRVEADEVLTNLEYLISRYESATVSDLYGMVGLPSEYTDEKWGWTDLRDAGIRSVREGFLLVLPRPEPL